MIIGMCGLVPVGIVSNNSITFNNYLQKRLLKKNCFLCDSQTFTSVTENVLHRSQRTFAMLRRKDRSSMLRAKYTLDYIHIAHQEHSRYYVAKNAP